MTDAPDADDTDIKWEEVFLRVANPQPYEGRDDDKRLLVTLDQLWHSMRADQQALLRQVEESEGPFEDETLESLKNFGLVVQSDAGVTLSPRGAAILRRVAEYFS